MWSGIGWQVGGRVEKSNRTRDPPVARLRSHLEILFRRPGFLRFVDRASRAKPVQWALEGPEYTQAVHGHSICTHAVPLTHSSTAALRTEGPPAVGERTGPTAFSISATRTLVGQLFGGTERSAEQSICTHAVPLTHSRAAAFRTEEPTARGERAGQTAFSRPAARALVRQHRHLGQRFETLERS